MLLGFNFYKDTIKNDYANFDGAASRSQYWSFYFWNVVVCIVLMVVAGILPDKLKLIMLLAYVVYAFALFIPNLAITVRRLHDSGKSALSLLWAFLPIFGGFILFVFMLLPTKKEGNQYSKKGKVSANSAEIEDLKKEIEELKKKA